MISGRRIAAALVAVQFVATIVIYLPRGGGVYPLSLVTAVVGIALVAVACRAVLRPVWPTGSRRVAR